MKNPTGTAPLVEVRVARRYRPPADRVFDAWLDPGIARKWLFATATRPLSGVSINARAGGSFRFVDREDGADAQFTGKYVEIVPPRRLVFTLSGKKRPREKTRVNVEIVPLDAGCELILKHENVRPEDARHIENRWTGILYGLGETLKRGG